MPRLHFPLGDVPEELSAEEEANFLLRCCGTRRGLLARIFSRSIALYFFKASARRHESNALLNCKLLGSVRAHRTRFQTKFFFKPPLRYCGLKGHDRRALLHEREISCIMICYCRVSAGAFFFVATSGDCREQ
jgi:hypothetical protein